MKMVTRADLLRVQQRIDKIAGLQKCYQLAIRSDGFGACLDEEPEWYLHKTILEQLEYLHDEIDDFKGLIDAD